MSHVVKVRPAEAGDRASVLAMLRAQWDEHAIALAEDVAVDALATFATDAGLGRLLVAAAPNGDLVGLAVLAFTFTLERGGRVAWLDELYVVPNERGRGVGTLLLDAALVAARESSCVAVELEVVFGHERAAHLYERAGFEKLPRARWSLDFA